jgi:TatD DNase family protein
VHVAALKFTDTHCHLDFHTFDDDRELVIERARESGLERILNPGIDLETSRMAIRLAERYPEVFAAVGVHPNCAMSWNDQTIKELAELASHPKVVAIGEIGLDYYRNNTPKLIQQCALHPQLELAGQLGLPVIIHNRNASYDIIPMLVHWQGELDDSQMELANRPGVLHSFAGEQTTSEQAIEMNFFIGVTGPVTFKNAISLQKIIQSFSLERVLIETDAPFLTPHPFRGKRNEPANVSLIAGKIAELYGATAECVADITTENATRLFHWREID